MRLLKKTKGPFSKKRVRRDLLFLFESLSYFLEAGFDVNYALQKIEPYLLRENPELFFPLTRTKISLSQRLTEFMEVIPSPQYKMWCGLILKLYEHNAGLSEALLSIHGTLREEETREFEQFSQTLPLKLNICLIVFFLPAYFLLLLTPLLSGFFSSF